jgi:hypothetical protein
MKKNDKNHGITTYPLKSRPSKVEVKNFAAPWEKKQSFQDFWRSFPDILAGKQFKEFIAGLKTARRKQKPILFALGAHVIKVGLNPVIIDLIQSGWIQGLAMNGAGIIHDFEIAYSGKTSEDVQAQLQDGRFGMARETGEMLNHAMNNGWTKQKGLGESIARMIHESDFPYKDFSLLAAACKNEIPVTVHVAIGTDVIHFHPDARGEVIGGLSMRDFFSFCKMVSNLDGGGVFINAGSAVVLPEVFLKAVSYVRNQGSPLQDFSTAVFDFIRHYRPAENVAGRPVRGGSGQGYYFIGHHEIMLPLVAAALISSDG